MGRPKLSDLSCSICNINFKKKSFFDKHMENHPHPEKQGRQARIRSNWCHVCRKSFEDDEYKLHIQTEHLFDSPKLNFDGSGENLFSYESGYVLLSKRKIKKEVDSSKKKASALGNRNNFDISLADIKTEPIEQIPETSDNAEKPPPIQKTILKAKPQKIKCTICGLRFKGERGLKIHMSAHKKSRKNSTDFSCSEEEMNEKKHSNQTPKLSERNPSLNSGANSVVLSNDGVINLGQGTQGGFILTVPQLQNQSLNSVLNIGNQPNNVLNFGNQPSNVINVENQVNNISTGNRPTVQLLSAPNQNTQSLDDIPKFDCNSEKYIKWLKKFTSKCKMHKYPLTPTLCQTISHVSEEIINALANPDGSLRKKSNHFYFIRMHDILSEIMLGHMRHALTVVIR